MNESLSRKRPCGLIRLPITVRWLAGGSYLDLAIAHQLSVSSVFMHDNSTIQAFEGVL